MKNRNIERITKVGKSNKSADGYIIVKVISGEFKTYNMVTNSFDSTTQNPNFVIFKDKDRALDVVARLCDEDKKHPVFLSAVAVCN